LQELQGWRSLTDFWSSKARFSSNEISDKQCHCHNDPFPWGENGERKKERNEQATQ